MRYRSLCIAVLLIGGMLLTLAASAQEKHEVKKGETLFSIGQEYGVEVQKIRKANDLEGASIEPGDVLQIPAEGTSTKTDTIEHEVEEGETLYSICQEYDADIDKVLELNPDAREEIEIGQVLRIPVGTDPPEEGGARHPFDTTRSGYHYHRIEKGQTLFSLSQRYGASIDTIRGSNPHLEEEPEVDQILRIPKEGTGQVEKDPRSLPDSLSTKNYRVYRAKKGETLYSIARRNGITLDRLLRKNPQIGKELKEDQALRIPQKGNARTPRSYQDTLILHRVQEGESIRSIATVYGTDPALIVMANDLFFRKIEQGELLLIPIPPRTHEAIPVDTARKDSFQITLLLPLYLKENDSILKEPEEDEKPELYGASSYALEFYEGFCLAADSVAQHRAVSFGINTIPTRKGEEGLVKKLEQQKVHESDLVIGPFYNTNLDRTAEYLKGKDLHHVCPVRHSNKVLLDHPRISKAIPSPTTLLKSLAERVVQEHGHRNVLLLDSGEPQDDEREKIFRERFDQLLSNIDSAYRDSLLTVSIKKGNGASLEDALKKDTMNILVAPSQEKVFASRLMNRLGQLNDRLGENRDYPTKVYASEDWKKFKTIDIQYKERFGLHIITSRHIQHDSLSAQRFYKSYRERNHTDPGSYGFLGYDVGSFYLNGLSQFGSGLSAHFDQVRAPTVHLDFDLFRTGLSSGYENQHSYLIRYTMDHCIERTRTQDGTKGKGH